MSSDPTLRELSVTAGAVFIGPWQDIDHEKFIVVAGVDGHKALVCCVLINSAINPFIRRRPKMMACQLEIKESDYGFLSHKSYINCAQPVTASFRHFLGDEYRYCGLLTNKDLIAVQKLIIASGVMTDDELGRFFKS